MYSPLVSFIYTGFLHLLWTKDIRGMIIFFPVLLIEPMHGPGHTPESKHGPGHSLEPMHGLGHTPESMNGSEHTLEPMHEAGQCWQ